MLERWHPQVKDLPFTVARGFACFEKFACGKNLQPDLHSSKNVSSGFEDILNK